MNPWMWHVPILITMSVLILVFLLLEGYFKKLKFLGISSVIACGLFVVLIVLTTVPGFLNITGIKMVGHVVSFLVYWPMIAVSKILNLERVTLHSYRLVMLLEIGLFIINTFTIFGIIRPIIYLKHLRLAKKALTKAGTSIGANYREANRARSKADFRNKIKICESEASETQYWLEIIVKLKWLSWRKVKGEYQECKELLAIFTSVGSK